MRNSLGKALVGSAFTARAAWIHSPLTSPPFLMGDGLSCVGSSYEFLHIAKASAVFTYLPGCTGFCISLDGLGSLEICMKVFTF